MTTIVPFADRHVGEVAALCAAEGWSSWTSQAVSAAFSAPGVLAVVAEEVLESSARPSCSPMGT